MKSSFAKETHRCCLEIVSPVHIGCDDVYEPTGFVADPDGSRLVVFDPLVFISAMRPEEKEKFSALCKTGTIASILEIYKFLQGKHADGRSIPVCGDFTDHYRKTLSLPSGNERQIKQELNQFVIRRTAFLGGDERPYIPGSSLKGALRTGYLNGLAATTDGNLRSQEGRGGGAELERNLMNVTGIPSDPFRLVKVSDFMPSGHVKTRIVYGVNEKKNPSAYDAKGPYQILEVIEPGAVFHGEITVEQPIDPRVEIKQPIDATSLFCHSETFYAKENRREDGELGKNGIQGIPIPERDRLCVIRVGQHSGAECLTVDGFRRIRIMGKTGRDSRYESGATTAWLASESRKPTVKTGLRPFGWAMLSELTTDMEDDRAKAEAVWKENAEAERQNRRAVIFQRQKSAEEAEQRAAEEKERLLAAERRKAEIELLPPFEKDVARLSDPSLLENLVVEIYNRLDGYSEDEQKTLADALKTYWIANGKWQKKACSKKQLQKVRHVKDILGEGCNSVGWGFQCSGVRFQEDENCF